MAHVKGNAIAREVDFVCQQYEESIWKNVIVIGDARFERCGPLAPPGAAVGMDALESNTLAAARSDRKVLPYSELVKVTTNTKVDPRPFLRLRMKTCRLVDGPDLDEFVVQ